MSQAWIPPRGELEKKVVVSPCRGDETTTSYDKGFVKSIPLRPRGKLHRHSRASRQPADSPALTGKRLSHAFESAAAVTFSALAGKLSKHGVFCIPEAASLRSRGKPRAKIR